VSGAVRSVRGQPAMPSTTRTDNVCDSGGAKRTSVISQPVGAQSLLRLLGRVSARSSVA
jgi:hypothetical protein